jgi:hypothetical protein
MMATKASSFLHKVAHLTAQSQSSGAAAAIAIERLLMHERCVALSLRNADM